MQVLNNLLVKYSESIRKAGELHIFEFSCRITRTYGKEGNNKRNTKRIRGY